MIIFIDKNLYLELIKKSHSRELFELTDSNRAFLRKWLPWVDFTKSEKDTLNFIERTKKNINGNNGLQFVIKYNKKIAGVIGLVEIGKFENKTEIGYWLAKSYNGKGIMTKSCRALVNYCFDQLNLNRVLIKCNVKNKVSRGIPERLGFFKQGKLKRDGFNNGKYADHVQYSVRKKEWYDQNNACKIIFGCHDSQADTYDYRIYEDSKNKNNYIREKYFEVHKEVLRMTEVKDKKTILDIGIGTGLFEERIKEKAEIYGIDISKKMMEKIKEKKLNVIELKKGSFTNIPYEKKSFDIIVSCFAFHHLADDEKEKSIFEMKRVLKENGRIVIGDFMYLNENVRKNLIKKFKDEKRNDMIQEMDRENFTNVENFKVKLEENGFEVEYKQVSTISWVIKAELSIRLIAE